VGVGHVSTGRRAEPETHGACLPTVVLLPPAGGSAVLGRAWSAALDGRARVEPLRVPRASGGGVGESARVVAGRTPSTGRWVLAGHSLGGLLAFEVVRVLEADGLHLPEHVVVMGSRPPHQATGPLVAGLVDLPDDEMLAGLARTGAVEASLPEHPMRRLFVPGLRADLRLLVDTPAASTDATVGVPVHAWHGTDDRLAPPAAAGGWATHAAGPFRSRTFRGGHFFPVEQAAEVVAALPLRAAPVGAQAPA
jgi:surfactin synthase thioesterase subunit